MANNARTSLTGTSVGSALLGLLAVFGCGDDTGLGQRYPVYGTVTYKGQPVEKGQISFIPTDASKGRAANGFIENGSYKLTTANPGDGALPGEYGVTVTSKAIDDTKIVETITKYGGGGRQTDIGKAAAKAKNLIPGKYQLAETSKLKYTIKEGSNKIDIDLED